MNVLFLGTGTSHGVPMIGCDCEVCRSSDPRDKRLRTSILIETDEGSRILVDTTPDLRTQALAHDMRRVDAILFTHTHADHIMGLDEVRRYNWISKKAMTCYGQPAALNEIRRIFAYAFAKDPESTTYVPSIDLVPIDGEFTIGGQTVVPIPVMHGNQQILGYRVGGFAYLTDCSSIPDASLALLTSLDVVVLDALRRKSHPSHFTLDQAIAAARHIGAGRTYFTHMSHDLGHAETCASLPERMTLAYDGLSVSL